jgi:hypothetical protein
LIESEERKGTTVTVDLPGVATGVAEPAATVAGN